MLSISSIFPVVPSILLSVEERARQLRNWLSTPWLARLWDIFGPFPWPEQESDILESAESDKKKTKYKHIVPLDFPRGRAPNTTHRGLKPIVVRLGKKRRRVLERDAKRMGRPYSEVVRVRIILDLARDPCVTAVAKGLRVDPKTVRLWRGRYLNYGRRGLQACPNPGRPVQIDSISRCQVIAMACGKPTDFGICHRSKWTISSLHQTFLEKNPDLSEVSRSSLYRILQKADIRPHRMRYWLHSPDPKFREKTTKICELYLSPPPNSIVLCIDEKPGMQALGRKHPTKTPTKGKSGKIDYEYIRNGTRTLICAFNPHTGQAVGQVGPTRTGEDLIAFMEQIAMSHPGKEIFVIWDNLNIHYDGPEKRWTRFNERHNNRFHFYYTPLHASWVNQVEMFFGIVQKRILKHTVYNSTQELESAVLAFIQQWNGHECHPFRWKFKGYPLQTGKDATSAQNEMRQTEKDTVDVQTEEGPDGQE